ncbi:MAG TPA: hemerythrin, partial [Thermotoga sp.]|nr:hemerythrin [Thermotoga sp.]
MWKERYKIGAPLVDQQHKELFKRVSAFIQVVQSDVPWELKVEKVKETLSFMQRYVIEHFEAEEKFQEEIGYPGLEEHRKIHEQFKGAIQQYVDRFEKEGFTKKLV